MSTGDKSLTLRADQQIDVTRRVVSVIRNTLALGDEAVLVPDTRLLGSMTELDSMSLVAVIAELESEFDIRIEDDDLHAELLATVRSLAEFIESKRPGQTK